MMDSNPPGRPLEFDNIQIGDQAELTHTLTADDLQAFANLTGDRNPLHLDATFAGRTPFRRPIAHGLLSASFISTLIGMHLPGQGALWTSQKLEFLQPAYVGDTIRVVAHVKHKSPATRMLVLEIAITNQNNQRLVAGEATVKALPIENKERAVEASEARTVLITGGSGGIGTATARLLAQAGHTVVVHFRRNAEAADRLVADIVARGGHAIALGADVAQAADVTALFAQAAQRAGPIQAVVHCAALPSALSPFTDLTWATVQQQLDVQVQGAFNCVQAALPAMLEAQTGAFVFVGSVAADGAPPLHQADYVIAKAALSALARSVAVEYGPKGIRANVVAPGMIQTAMTAGLPEKARMLTRMQTPLRRLGDPDDVAAVIAFLLSPAARHVTGETLRVCGGSVML